MRSASVFKSPQQHSTAAPYRLLNTLSIFKLTYVIAATAIT